jgi:hypothetical protein
MTLPEFVSRSFCYPLNKKEGAFVVEYGVEEKQENVAACRPRVSFFFLQNVASRK